MNTKINTKIKCLIQLGSNSIPLDPLTNNYWYDPFFTKPASTGYMSDPTSHLNLWGTSGGGYYQMTPNVTDPLNVYPSCAKLIIEDSAVEYIGLSFSKKYLNLLGWSNGQTFRCGFYIQFPAATVGTPRRVYVRKNGSSTWQTIDCTSSIWTWIGIDESVTIDDSVLQGFDFAVRYCVNPEPIYITGLTIQNTTLTTWKNELLESYAFRNRRVTVQNQYVWEEYIDPQSPLYLNSFDQNEAAITKEIVDLRVDNTAPVESDALKITNETGKVNRPNVFLTNNSESNTALNFELIPKDVAVKVQLGCWVKCVANASNIWSARWLNLSEISNKQNHQYLNLPTNQWIWIESLPIEFAAESEKVFQFNQEIIQLKYAYTDESVFYITGLTWGYVNDIPVNFGNKRYYNLASIANLYRIKWISYGDSILGNGNIQPNVLAKTAMKHTNRGIGGTTVCNNQAIAYVNNNGDYLTRPPSPKPEGSITIESSMCRQQRIDTIPIDTELITILGGSNDCFNSFVLGTINDSASDGTSATFYSAYKSLIDKIKLRCPSAKIVILGIIYRHDETTYENLNGETLPQFRQACIDIASIYNLQYINLYDLGVDNSNWYDYSYDEVHPNYYFAKVIGKEIAKELILHS